MNSEQLRLVGAELDSAAEAAGNYLLSQEAAHKVALTRAVLANEHSEADATEAAVSIARTAFHLAVEKRDEARHLLSQALRDEKAAAQELARRTIEAGLKDLESQAAGIDDVVGEVVSRIIDLRASELKLRRLAFDNFREPPGGPEYFGALRSIASYLTATASGVLQPNRPDAVTRAVAAGSKAIRSTINNG